MLYIFNNRNAIQIVWGSTVSQNKVRNRTQELDTRFGTIGFIRTRSIG